jgi:pteridine reductase
MDLSGKRVLVTGGAVRIGRAICEALAARGCTVMVHYRESEREALALVDSLRATGAEAFAVHGALSGAPSCKQLVEACVAAAGGLDILVNNAAVFHRDSLMDTTAAKLQVEMEINAFVPIFLTQELVRLGSSGKIVNLLDRRVEGFECGALPYVLSKKLLADFTKLAALELAPGFTVNAVAPGPVLPPPGDGPDRTRELAGATPLGGGMTPEAVAQADVYLLEADAITGQTLFVDGGQRLGEFKI